MPELGGSISTSHEQAAAGLETEQTLRAEAAAIIGDHSLRGYAETQGDLVSSAEAAGIILEMPPTHPDVDPATITVPGLIKACSRFAAIAASNPVLAERMAASAIESAQQKAEMQRQGMDDKAIRKQQWSEMLKQHRAQASPQKAPKADKAVEQPVAEHETKPAPEVSKAVPPEATLSVAAEQAPPPRIDPRTKEVSAVEYARAERAATPAVLPAHSRAADFAFIPEAAAARAMHEHRLFDELNEPEHASFDRETGSNQQLLNPEAAIRRTMDIEQTATDDATPDGMLVVEGASSDSPSTTVGTTSEKELPAITIGMPANFEHEPGAAEQQRSGAEASEAAEGEAPTAYDYFTDALHAAVVATAQEGATSTEAAHADGPRQPAEVTEEVQAPSIAVAVIERLSALETEQQAELAPVFESIIEEIQAVNALVTAEAGPETIETAQVQLEELVEQLLERLDIAYEPEDVECFTSFLLRPDFLPVASPQRDLVDLEHEGTHEAKLHFTRLMSSLSDAEDAAARLLGKLVVFHATPLAQAEPVLAAA